MNAIICDIYSVQKLKTMYRKKQKYILYFLGISTPFPIEAEIV